MRGFLEYLAACLLIIAILGTIAWMVVGPESQAVVLMSAGLTLVVQLVSFAVARLFLKKNFMLGWGLGSLLRLVVLVIYAVVVARLWRAPATPALLSFVVFLFVTTVVEPVFLRR